jgi:hypothetical protein
VLERGRYRASFALRSNSAPRARSSWRPFSGGPLRPLRGEARAIGTTGHAEPLARELAFGRRAVGRSGFSSQEPARQSLRVEKPVAG